MAENNTNDAVLQAIDTLISQRISNLDYDQTVICKITDASDAQNGHYVVNDGSISFDAYSENSEYAENESVYVTVPKGDFTQKKVIISKYTANNNEDPLAYKSPLDQMFRVTENMSPLSQLRNNGIVANGRQEVRQGEFVAPGAKHLIWEYDLSTSENASIRNNAVFDSFGIRCKFKCSLGTAYNIKEGNYGLAIALYSNLSSDASGNDTAYKTELFDISEMFGNPYMFLAYLEQSKVIDISNLNNITKINIYLYQSDNFTYQQELDTGEIITSRIPNTITTHQSDGMVVESEINPNIFVNDLELYFGMNLTNVEDNTFQIYNASSTTYDLLNETPNYNQKNIIPIWFNKDEENNYIGFSDGIHTYYDFHGLDNGSDNQPIGRAYDERDYLDIAAYLERGAKLNQQDLTDLGIPTIQELLQIYAYAEDVQSLIESMTPYLNSKLNKNLNQIITDIRQYQDKTQQTASSELRNSFLNNPSSGLSTLWNYLEVLKDKENLNGWMQKNIIILKEYGDVFVGNDNMPTKSELQSQFDSIYNIYTTLSNYVNIVKNNVENNYFQKFKTENLIDEDVMAIWDLWHDSTSTIFETVEDYLEQIHDIITLTHNSTIIDANQSANKQYLECISWSLSKAWYKFSQSNFEDYESSKEKIYASYENRYCIYWYKYNPGYKDENEKFLSANWELIEGSGGSIINEGLPADNEFVEADDKNKYWVARPSGGTTVSINIGDATKTFERIRAVLVYNHEVFISNIIEFTNERPVIDEESVDATKGLYIAITDEEYSTTEFDDNGDPVLLQKDTYNNKETYQLYGVTGYLVNQAERYKIRKLRARFNGAGKKGDNYLSKNCVIYWYIPLNATMIDVQRKDLIDAGFSVYDPSYTRGEDELKEEITTLQNTAAQQNWSDDKLNSEIQKAKDNFVNGKYPAPPAPYGNNYQQGYLMAWKKIQAKEDDIDSVDIESTECFYQIKDYFIPSFTNNTIKCRVVKDSQYVYDAEISFTFASFGTNGTDYSLCIVPADNQAVLLDNKALRLKIAVYDVNGKILEEETNKIEVGWEHYQGGVTIAGSAPDIVVSRINKSNQIGYNVLKASTKIKIESYSEAERAAGGEGTNDISKEVTTNKTKRTDREVILTAYYPIAWASEDLYAEGPNIVVYDSLGGNPSYYNGPYKLFYGSSQNKAHSQYSITGGVCNAGMIYWDGKATNKTPTTLVKESLPKLKLSTSTSSEKSICSNTTQQADLSVPSMYLENDFFASVGIKDGNNKLIYFTPIIMMQNRFSSPMLNAWDGELTIDEENGTILASMVGAGIKEKDNSFSGVLMGDVAAKTEDSSAGAGVQGLYGFDHGEQSFGFKVNGKAFIGKSGKGRIEFDGNSGTIQSMSYSVNKLGMKLDLDDGEIDMRGAYVDKNNQSEAWQAASVTEEADDGSIISYVPEDKQEALNNNEINGYDNSTKYTPTGSRVNISTKTPFFTIQSPSVVYTTETSLERSVQTFWDGVTYYKSKENIISFLNQYYDLYDSEVWLNTAVTVVKKSNTYKNNIKGSLSGSGFYIKFAEALKPEDVSENLIKKISNFDATGFIYKGENIEHLEGDEDGGDTEATTESDYVFLIGDALFIQDANTYIYYPINQATTTAISLLPTDSDHHIVNHNGALQSKITDVDGSELNITSYSTVDALATAILNTDISTTKVTKDNYLTNLKVRLLPTAEFETIENLYNNINGSKQSNTLMLVGTEQYYLQTDNYHIGLPNDSRGGVARPYANGKGLKFDLMKGTLDAYNFSLLAADPRTGGYIKLNSNGSPYFQVSYRGDNRNQKVKDDNQSIDLINITKSNFVLQSQNWYSDKSDPTVSSGTQLDMSNGTLKSYNFDLIAYDNNADYAGSYLELSSKGNPYIKVHYKKQVDYDDHGSPVYQDLDLLNISRSTFLLQSQDWNDSGSDIGKKSGTQLNLSKGKLTSYSFDLTAYNNGPSEKLERYKGSYVRMNSTGEPYLKVHFEDSQYKRKTKVDISQYTQKQLDDAVKNGTMIKYSSSFKKDDPYYVPAGHSKDGTYWLITNDQVSSDLILVTNQKFVIQSANYSAVNQTGIRLDLNDGVMETYNFRISVVGVTYSAIPERDEKGQVVPGSYYIDANKRGIFTIDGTDANAPIKLEGLSDPTNSNYQPGSFKVYWDGSIEAKSGLIGGWAIYGADSSGSSNIPKGIYSYNPRNRTSGSGVALYANGTSGNPALRIAVGEKTSKEDKYYYLVTEEIDTQAWTEVTYEWEIDTTIDQSNYNAAREENRMMTGTVGKDAVYYYKKEKTVEHKAGKTTIQTWKEDTTSNHSKYNQAKAKETSENKPEGTYATMSAATENTDAKFMVEADGSVTATGGKFYSMKAYTAKIEGLTAINSTITTATISEANITSGLIGGFTIRNGELSGGTIRGGTIIGGTITGGIVTGGSVSGATISGGSITGSNIRGAIITGGSINGANITASGYVTCSGLIVSGKTYSARSFGEKDFLVKNSGFYAAGHNLANSYSVPEIDTFSDLTINKGTGHCRVPTTASVTINDVAYSITLGGWTNSALVWDTDPSVGGKATGKLTKGPGWSSVLGRQMKFEYLGTKISVDDA